MRVGTSLLSLSLCLLSQDHPHACGDKLAFAFPSIALLGSSPCVWGQVKNVPLEYEYTGIIPMRVGTSVASAKCWN